jgi:hypothetical protein
MKIVREFMPNGMPMLIQANTNDEGYIHIPSTKIFPIDEGKVLPALPLDIEDPMLLSSAVRLASVLYSSENQDTENN